MRAALQNKHLLALLGILALGAALRLWNLTHLFNAVHDADEGVYSLGSRFMTEGYLPYQDFILAHPPLFNQVLAIVYNIFGYDFFYGKYLVIGLSLASIVILYLIGKKLFNPSVGIIAAGLFAVSPEMVYLGRRVVQEPLGIFLILLAIYFASAFIKNGTVNKRLLFSGMALGLAVAVKFSFIPAAAAIILVIFLISLSERLWRSVSIFGKPRFWVSYLSFIALFYGLLLIPRLALNTLIPLPFFDTAEMSWEAVIISTGVFLVPLIGALAVCNTDFPFKQWFDEIWKLRLNQGVWLIIGGFGVGFLSVTGYYLLTMPREFFDQTILMQIGRSGAVFPSLTGFVKEFYSAEGFLKVAFVPVLVSIPLVVIILNRAKISRPFFFLAAGTVISLALCQIFYSLPRYYLAVFPFFILALSSLFQGFSFDVFRHKVSADSRDKLTAPMAVFSVFVLFLSVSLAILYSYPSYDTNSKFLASDEERIYQETIEYLEDSGAQKVYAVNPIYVALAPDINSTLAFESYALLWFEEKPASEIVQNLKDEGVDYIVLDAWVRYWGADYEITQLVGEIRNNSTLVMRVGLGTNIWTEVYLLDTD